jgi:hypothetical protein
LCISGFEDANDKNTLHYRSCTHPKHQSSSMQSFISVAFLILGFSSLLAVAQAPTIPPINCKFFDKFQTPICCKLFAQDLGIGCEYPWVVYLLRTDRNLGSSRGIMDRCPAAAAERELCCWQTVTCAKNQTECDSAIEYANRTIGGIPKDAKFEQIAGPCVMALDPDAPPRR